MKRIASCLVLLGWLFPVFFARAAIMTMPFAKLQAVVWVQCGDRQGSGTIINGEQGYVLTNAHVAIDITTGVKSSTCVVGLIDENRQQPKYFYRSQVMRFGFDQNHNADFAILQIGRRITPSGPERPFSALVANAFPELGQRITVIGFAGNKDSLVDQSGTIQRFEGGYVQTNAEILPGNSGGAGLDDDHDLVGIPSRIVTITNERGSTTQTNYELVDIRAVMNWLDTYGQNEHDRYFTHADYKRYHQSAVFINQSTLGCDYVARSPHSSAVFCLLPGNERLVFPNAPTFQSWFSSFADVVFVADSALTPYRITRNVTFKPGTLVKSQTASAVYVVVDSFGTLRWIPSETHAKELWGPNWANLVYDIPDEFFTNYAIGQPLEPLTPS